MPIRQVVQTGEASAPEKTHRITKITINEDSQIFVHWVIEKQGKRGATREGLSVQVSPALNQLIVNRATFQTWLDQITTDTFERTGA